MGLKIEKVSKREYKLLEDITVDANGYEITIKKGFVFDGASIPQFLWSFIGSPFTGNYTLAALVHDALYRSNSFNRKNADKIFLALMKQDGVSFFKRRSMYLGVRFGGSSSWTNRTKDEIKKAKQFMKIKRSK